VIESGGKMHVKVTARARQVLYPSKIAVDRDLTSKIRRAGEGA